MLTPVAKFSPKATARLRQTAAHSQARLPENCRCTNNASITNITAPGTCAQRSKSA